MTFLKYLGSAERVNIRLCGAEVSVERARLGRHLLLGELRTKITKALDGRDAELAVQCLRDYLATASGQDTDSLVEMADAVDSLWALNAFKEHIAFMEAAPKPGKPAEHIIPYEYTDRFAAVWVDAIAHAYGWSHAEILDLVPEMAGYYFQEIVLRDTTDREWDYTVHGLGVGKNGRYRPYPKAAWMNQVPIDRVMTIPKAMMPMGNVVKLGGEPETSKS